MTTNSNELDAALIEQIKKGDTLAFRQLVDKYKDVSLSLAFSILKDKAKAEDVLQEAFLKVFYKADTFKHQSSLSTWLYRIVINKAYNELKRNRKQLDLDELNFEEPEIKEKSAFQNLRDQDQKRYIICALSKLKADESLVLRLFYLCELSIQEIEEVTNFSQSKIKVDLHRGRKNFETALKHLLGKQVIDLL